MRLSHRARRDKRITTHCGLVSRAFGADSIVISGDKDTNVIDSLKKVSKTWGGPFDVVYEKDWKSFVKDKKKNGFKVAHLTMYGTDFKKNLKDLTKKDLVIIIGSEKVPPEVYELSDYNTSIGNQPHSEVAALGVFLYELSGLKKDFKNAKRKIIPSKKGKTIKQE